MEIILCPKEWTKERLFVHSFVEDESEEELAHGDDSFIPINEPILCTKEFADEYSLMHYRRGGEKKGIRRWQNEDGSYTSAGREHYAEMYGWGKFRADRAQAKSDKYARKAERAKAELDKRQVQSDRAHVKLDRKGTDKAAEKSKLADRRLNEAKLRYDTYSMKANKYQNKSDKLHDKWDDDTRRFFEKEKTVTDRTESNRKQSDSDELNSRYVEGSKAWQEDAEFWRNKVEKFRELGPDERRDVEKRLRTQMEEDLKRIGNRDPDDLDTNHQNDAFIKYRQSIKALQKNYDQLSPEMRDYTVDNVIKICNGDKDNPDSPFNKFSDNFRYGGQLGKPVVFTEDDGPEDWLMNRMDQLSGNMNGDQWKSGSRGEKAAKDVHAKWDKAEARAKEVGREIGITDEDAWWNPRSKDYEKLQKALANDKLYASIKENGDKSEKDLVKAVAQDMGFHITSEILNALGWFVWRD